MKWGRLPFITSHYIFLQIASKGKSSHSGKKTYFDHISGLTRIIKNIVTIVHQPFVEGWMIFKVIEG
jgi:hypothetical protein